MHGSESAAPKLAPEMASFRLLVLGFVRNYHHTMGACPSYGEIAAKLGSNRTRVRKAVKSLAAEGLLIQTPGPRSLHLPDARDAAIRQLRAMGWFVDEDVVRATAPVTKRTLLTMAALDYNPVPDLRRGGPAGGSDGEHFGKGSGQGLRPAAQRNRRQVPR